jgi:hypothetical protein
MQRLIVFLAVWQLVVASAAGVAGQVIHLEGQIVGGQGGFLLHPLPYMPFGGLPVPYRGVFTYEPGGSRATFELTVGTGLESWPSADLFATNIFDGVVQNDATTLFVDLTSPPASWITSFELMLDKTTGQGQWYWREFQPLACTPTVCAPGGEAVPGGSNAWGTITAFREVPEPGTIAMAVVLLVWVQLRRARITSAGPDHANEPPT